MTIKINAAPAAVLHCEPVNRTLAEELIAGIESSIANKLQIDEDWARAMQAIREGQS